MTSQIVLTAQQLQVVRDASGPIQVCDDSGSVLGQIERSHFTAAEIAQAEADLDSVTSWHSTQEVLARLESLGTS